MVARFENFDGFSGSRHAGLSQQAYFDPSVGLAHEGCLPVPLFNSRGYGQRLGVVCGGRTIDARFPSERTKQNGARHRGREIDR